LYADLALVEGVGSFQEAAQAYVRVVVDNLHWKSPESDTFLHCQKIKKDGIIYQLICDESGISNTPPLSFALLTLA
jgi:hypothetical protein